MLVLIGLLSWDGLRSYFSRRSDYRRVEARLTQTEARIKDKRRRVALAEANDAFLEREARKNLGLIRPDELEFRFGRPTDTDDMKKKLDDSVTQKE